MGEVGHAQSDAQAKRLGSLRYRAHARLIGNQRAGQRRHRVAPVFDRGPTPPVLAAAAPRRRPPGGWSPKICRRGGRRHALLNCLGSWGRGGTLNFWHRVGVRAAMNAPIKKNPARVVAAGCKHFDQFSVWWVFGNFAR